MRRNPSDDETLLLLNRATLLTHLVRGAAHELNNVLQTIQGSAELLGARPDFPSHLQPRVENIAKHTTRATAIVQHVAQFARGGATATPARVSVARAIERAVDLRRFELRRAGITAEVPATDPALVVRVAADQFEQILLNLLVNAEQALAGREGGVIRIDVTGGEGSVRVSVADNGPGLENRAGEAEDPFAAFVTRRGSAAAGLGLTVARLLAEAAGGTLEYAGTADGAAFNLHLPSPGD